MSGEWRLTAAMEHPTRTPDCCLSPFAMSFIPRLWYIIICEVPSQPCKSTLMATMCDGPCTSAWNGTLHGESIAALSCDSLYLAPRLRVKLLHLLCPRYSVTTPLPRQVKAVNGQVPSSTLVGSRRCVLTLAGNTDIRSALHHAYVSRRLTTESLDVPD